MKKRLLYGIPVSLALIWLLLGFYGMHQIKHFERLSLQAVLDSPERMQSYGMQPGMTDPSAYGATDFQTVHYVSTPDGVQLEAWYIPAVQKKTRDCVLILHGRGTNRLKQMKMIGLLRELGVHRDHCILLPDLRNSGGSAEAESSLGWDFAEDIVSSMETLKQKWGHDRFVLYAFSTSAMATGVLHYRPDLKERMKAGGLAIKALVFDSPLSNSEANYYFLAHKKFGLPDFVMAGGITFFGWQAPFRLDELRLSHLYPAYQHLPLIIFQSQQDQTTPYSIFEHEYAQIKDPAHIQLHVFEAGDHVRIYQNPLNTATYKSKLAAFFQAHLRAGVPQ
ncbi:MAG: hypothetical protein KDK39_03995 [Leptospiraceae bacterium]|nr:hypothetical protein [Leptospiraceae bacterium]